MHRSMILTLLNHIIVLLMSILMVWLMESEKRCGSALSKKIYIVFQSGIYWLLKAVPVLVEVQLLKSRILTLTSRIPL